MAKCKFKHHDKCKGEATITNKHGVPMCDPCHNHWVNLKRMDFFMRPLHHEVGWRTSK